MKRKIFIGLVALIACFFVYKLGMRLYHNYTFSKIRENVEKRGDRVDNIILDSGGKDLKTNDLIYVCELRKALWNTNVDIETIQILAEHNNQKYKQFSKKMYTAVNNDKYVIEHSFNNKVDYKKSDVIGTLCTLVFPETQTNRSLYGKLLSQKYQVESGTIGDVDSSKITPEDLNEYDKAKIIEEKLRLRF